MSNWQDWFHANESPYFSMFRAGINGIALEDVTDHCASLGIPIREKDVRAWQDGKSKRDFSEFRQRGGLNLPTVPVSALSVAKRDMKLTDFDKYEPDYVAPAKRWFPCTADNKPMQKWGYKDNYTPVLYTRETAQALAPTNYVGQNMLGQRYIVIDIDGVGHGDTDEKVIAFGNKYRDKTEVWENPAKPGSFHLYFWTDRKLPVIHAPYAKLDFMGNAVNAAVYTKNKQPNNVPRAFLTEEIWEDLKEYLNSRREE